jgi:hypothetical protein
MPYTNHFLNADHIIAHLNTIIPGIPDPILVSKYIGFVSVAAVAVYELSIKEIFISFANKKNKVFGQYTQSHFSRINGHIKIKELLDDYTTKFGEKYRKRFDKILKSCAKKYLLANRRDIISSYSNIITWRNEFAHEGRLVSTTTYNEAIQAYEDGKEVIRSLSLSMVR